MALLDGPRWQEKKTIPAAIRMVMAMAMHVRFYAQLKHIERATCGLDQTAGWPSMCVRQVARLQYSAAGWTSVLV